MEGPGTCKKESHIRKEGPRIRKEGPRIRKEGPRILREKVTVTHMLSMYCNKRHREYTHLGSIEKEELCDSCAQLLQYAYKRLSYCRFGEGKTTCGKCPIHCYKPDMREQMQQAMRHAGPRMIYRHPILAVQHLLDGFRKPRQPVQPKKPRKHCD